MEHSALSLVGDWTVAGMFAVTCVRFAEVLNMSGGGNLAVGTATYCFPIICRMSKTPVRRRNDRWMVFWRCGVFFTWSLEWSSEFSSEKGNVFKTWIFLFLLLAVAPKLFAAL